MPPWPTGSPASHATYVRQPPPFTATSSYPTTRNLNDVQQELVEQMVKDLTDQIFNATVANW